ncbi:hypothetical protein B296_00026213 [Ensete ventricosum]|uniref:Uncharacterized protein n=1 Tax=Ensete ventricosum TaxID=4639 RepID=A0A427ARY5_ENSVE|nr:hypothetical protein B296_00026213 [Ensete ventricosum]
MSSYLIWFIDSISPLNTVNLHVTFDTGPNSKTVLTKFMVVDIPSVFNAIIGQPTLNRLWAMMSTYHMSILTRSGVEELKSNPRESCKYYLTVMSFSKKLQLEVPLMDRRDAVKPMPHLELIEPFLEVPLDQA